MSAVAYVLSGICKDILLVTLGAVLWAEVVTFQQLVGYGIALAGLGYYNYMGKVAAARKNGGGKSKANIRPSTYREQIEHKSCK